MLWVVLALTAGVTLGSIHHEGQVREEQLCGVVINVHHNAEFRLSTEKQNLSGTLDYLHDPDSKKDSPSLYKRVQENLPVARLRVIEAQAGVTATKVPPVCEKYV